MNSSDAVPVGVTAAQVAFLALIVGGLLGLAGLIALCLMVWFSHQRFGVDRSAKHGISVKDTSRMGGVALALFLLVIWIGSVSSVGLNYPFLPGFSWSSSFFILALLIGFIGFFDDLGLSFTPFTRLILTAVILLIGFVLVPSWLPNRILIFLGTNSFAFDVLLLVFSIIICIGFINAGNMADGANGLFSGICLAFFFCAWWLTAQHIYFMLIIGLLCFFLINVLTGRIIMGDFGAYGISALIALTGFDLFDQELVGLAYLATLLSYPCLEMLRIFFVRIYKGRSPFQADNQHVHNALNGFFKVKVRSNTLANSLTGVLIASLSTMPAVFLLLQGAQTNELLCAIVFAGQCLIFAVIHRRYMVNVD